MYITEYCNIFVAVLLEKTKMQKKHEVRLKLKKYSRYSAVADAVEMSTDMVRKTLHDERNNERIVEVSEALVNLIENFQTIVQNAGKDFSSEKNYYVPTKPINKL